MLTLLLPPAPHVVARPGWVGLLHIRNLVHRRSDGHKELISQGQEVSEGDVHSSLDFRVAQGLLWGDVVGEVAVGRGMRSQPEPPL